MKTLSLFIITLFLSTFSFSQRNALDKYFKDYLENENYTKMNITAKAFEMLSHFDAPSEEAQRLKEQVMNIDLFQAVFNEQTDNGKSQYSEALKRIPKQYEELMTVTDKEGNFTFLINESNGIVYEVLMIGGSTKEFGLASITGNLDLNEIGKITSQVNQDGWGYMEKVFESGADKIEIYPNPAASGTQVTVVLPENLMDSNLKIFDPKGSLVKSEKINSSQHQIDTRNFKSGKYVFEITGNEGRIRKIVVIN